VRMCVMRIACISILVKVAGLLVFLLPLFVFSVSCRQARCATFSCFGIRSHTRRQCSACAVTRVRFVVACNTGNHVIFILAYFSNCCYFLRQSSGFYFFFVNKDLFQGCLLVCCCVCVYITHLLHQMDRAVVLQ